MEKIQKPFFVSQTVMPPFGLERRHPGRPPKVAPSPAATAAVAIDGDVARDRVRPLGGLHPLKPLIREWLLELKVMGRSPRTIKWYEQKLDWYFRADGVVNLEALTAFELKRSLAISRSEGSPTTPSTASSRSYARSPTGPIARSTRLTGPCSGSDRQRWR